MRACEIDLIAHIARSAADSTLSQLDSSRADVAAFRNGPKVPECADFSQSSSPGNHANAFEKRGLDDWNVEDL